MPSPGKREAENDENRQTNDASKANRSDAGPSSITVSSVAAPHHPKKKSRKAGITKKTNTNGEDIDDEVSRAGTNSPTREGVIDHNGEGESPGGGVAATETVNPSKPSTAKKSSGSRKGSEKTVRKDPRAPKRSKSAYIFFAMESREELKNQLGPKARVGDIAKATSVRWKALSDEKRKIWEDKAGKDRERYQQEKSEYTGPLLITKTPDGKQELTKKQRDPRQPKRPLTAFLYYCQAHRPAMKDEHTEWGVAELSKELGREWRDMTTEEKKPYLMHEEEERKRYQHLSAEYKKLIEEEKEKEAVERAKEELKRTKEEEEKKEALRRKDEKERKKQQKHEEKTERQRQKAEAAAEASEGLAPPSPVRSRGIGHDGKKRHESQHGNTEQEPSSNSAPPPSKHRGAPSRPQDHRSPTGGGRLRTGRVDASFHHYPASARRGAPNEDPRRAGGTLGSPVRSHRYPGHPQSARRGESYPYDAYGAAPQAAPPGGAGGPYSGVPSSTSFDRDRDMSDRDREYYKMYPHYGHGAPPPSPPPSSHYGYYPGGSSGYPPYPPYSGAPPGMSDYYAPPPARAGRPSSRGGGEGAEDMRSSSAIRPSASTEEDYSRKYQTRGPPGYPSSYSQPPPGYPGAEYASYPYGDPYYGAGAGGPPPPGHEGTVPPPAYGGDGGYYGSGAPPPSQAGYPPSSDPYYSGYHPHDYPPPHPDYPYPPPSGYDGSGVAGPSATSPSVAYGGGDPSLAVPPDSYYGAGRGGDGYGPPPTGYGPPPGGVPTGY